MSVRSQRFEIIIIDIGLSPLIKRSTDIKMNPISPEIMTKPKENDEF